jgi:hypothetical protein
MNCHARVQHKREVLSAKKFVRKSTSSPPVLIPVIFNLENSKYERENKLKPNGSFGGGNPTNKKSHRTYTLVLIRKNEKENYRGYRSIQYTFAKPQISGKVFNLYGKQWRVQ